MGIKLPNILRELLFEVPSHPANENVYLLYKNSCTVLVLPTMNMESGLTIFDTPHEDGSVANSFCPFKLDPIGLAI